MMHYLHCPCICFAPMKDDDPIQKAYFEALEQGKQEGFCPVLLKVESTLLETLTINADEDNGLDYELETIRVYREKQLETAQDLDGALCLESMLTERREELEEDGISWEEEIGGETAGGEPNDRFAAYWNYETEMTDELILAQIPVDEPWKIFAWLPIGGWNDCPDTPELMAVARHWYKTYGAVPASISSDEVEFYVKTPVKDVQQARKLALEHYAFCPDRVWQCEEDGSVGKLADSLTKSTVWYFWWD